MFRRAGKAWCPGRMWVVAQASFKLQRFVHGGLKGTRKAEHTQQDWGHSIFYSWFGMGWGVRMVNLLETG